FSSEYRAGHRDALREHGTRQRPAGARPRGAFFHSCAERTSSQGAVSRSFHLHPPHAGISVFYWHFCTCAFPRPAYNAAGWLLRSYPSSFRSSLMARAKGSSSLKRREFLSKTGSGLLAAATVPAGAWAAPDSPSPLDGAAFPPPPSRPPSPG